VECIVTFLGSKSFLVVPQVYLVKKAGCVVKCKWLKYKVTNNMIMKYQRPSEDWLEYDVKLVGLPYGKKILSFAYINSIIPTPI